MGQLDLEMTKVASSCADHHTLYQSQPPDAVIRCLRLQDSIILGPNDIYRRSDQDSQRQTASGFVARLPSNNVIFLSEYDSIVPSRDVADYCQAAGVSFHMMPGLDHSDALFSWPFLDRVQKTVDEVARIADVQIRPGTSTSQV